LLELSQQLLHLAEDVHVDAHDGHPSDSGMVGLLASGGEQDGFGHDHGINPVDAQTRLHLLQTGLHAAGIGAVLE